MWAQSTFYTSEFNIGFDVLVLLCWLLGHNELSVYVIDLVNILLKKKSL